MFKNLLQGTLKAERIEQMYRTGLLYNSGFNPFFPFIVPSHPIYQTGQLKSGSSNNLYSVQAISDHLLNNNYLLTYDSYVPLYNRFHRGEWITRVSGGECPGPPPPQSPT